MKTVTLKADKFVCLMIGVGLGVVLVSDLRPRPKLRQVEELSVSRGVRTVMKLPSVGMTDGRLFKAICMWEHRGVIRPDAINKKENAHGPAQIRQIYLDDSNQFAGTRYTLQDCHDYEIAFEVVTNYWARYRFKTPEAKARGHNGGPKGPQRSGTKAYWAGVQSYL